MFELTWPLRSSFTTTPKPSQNSADFTVSQDRPPFSSSSITSGIPSFPTHTKEQVSTPNSARHTPSAAARLITMTFAEHSQSYATPLPFSAGLSAPQPFNGESSNSRRRSDSAMEVPHDRLAVCEVAKLRKWAAEAMAAGTPPVESTIEEPVVASSSRAAWSDDPFTADPPRRRALPKVRQSFPSPSGRRSRPPYVQLERPSSSYISHSDAHPSALTYGKPRRSLPHSLPSSPPPSESPSPELAAQSVSPTLKRSSFSRKLMSGAGRSKDRPAKLKVNGSSSSTPTADGSVGPLSRATPSTARPSLTRSTPASARDDPALTPRPGPPHEGSPPSSTSTCESDDEKQLLTPLDDGLLSLGVGPGASPLSRSFSGGPPAASGLDDLPARRVGMDFGIGAIGASNDVGPLGLGLDGRRGSTTDKTPSPKAEDSSKTLVTPVASKMTAVPSLSRTTLEDLGRIDGITPPAIPEGLVGLISAGSVVSQGLEMGLGLSLATAGLCNSLPGASQAIAGFAEPRYSRNTGGSFDVGTLAASLRMTDTQLPPSQVTPEVNCASHASEQAMEDTHLSALERQENELNRRRTTGWIAGRARTEATRGTRQRSGTHDSAYMPLAEKTAPRRMHPLVDPFAPLSTMEEASTSTLSIESTEDSRSTSGASTSDNSNRARASGAGSTQAGTPSLGDKATLSPDAHQHLGSRGAFPGYSRQDSALERHGQHGPNGGRDPRYVQPGVLGPVNGGLMGVGGGGHFGPGVRAKVADVLKELIPGIPLEGYEGETVHMVEYGCLNSRSMQLMQSVVSHFAQRANAGQPQRAVDTAVDYFTNTGMPTVVGAGPLEDAQSMVNFSILHEDSPQADFRPLVQLLDSHSESYLNTHWQSTHQPSLQNMVFPSFVSRPFASRIAPPSTLHLGISLMDLHWSHTPRNPAVSLATTAHAELTAFLTARAHEFKKGGVFVMAYIARSEEDPVSGLPGRPRSTVNSPENNVATVEDGLSASALPTRTRRMERERSNSSPTRPAFAIQAPPKKSADIWTTLTNTLAPCLQRLVSCGMLKSDVARYLLSLPMHPRTPRQTQNVLKSVKHLWGVQWSCGLGPAADVPSETTSGPVGANVLPSEEETLRLPHPAWKALQSGTLSRVAFAEHMIQLFKNLYESHFRAILREKGRLSKGAVEFVLDSLWDVIREKLEDDSHPRIEECEIEVCVVALKRL